MAYSLEDQLYFDLNWYFVDWYKRVCHVNSGGSLLPQIIAENDKNNDEFHKIVFDKKPNFKAAINPNAERILRLQGNTDFELEMCFNYHESIAKKGLYSFGKLIFDGGVNNQYLLIAYPVYDKHVNEYPFKDEEIHLITRTKSIFQNYKNPFDLYRFFEVNGVFATI